MVLRAGESHRSSAPAIPWLRLALLLAALSLVAAACSGAGEAGGVDFGDGGGDSRPPSTTARRVVAAQELLGYGRADAPAGVFVDVSAGRFRTCGVRADGALLCWGETVGEVPAGRFVGVDIVDYEDDPYSSGPPVAAGYGCAVRVNGSLACWGDVDAWSQESPPEDFVDVSVHEGVICALTAGGDALCWGDLAPGADGAAVDGDFVEVFAGQVPCALGSEGTLVCWGQEILHVLPDPPEGEFIDLSMTHGYACGVRADSELVCWDDGPTSSSSTSSYRSATPHGDGFAAVSVGSSHACALRADGSLVCWGSNSFGQVDPAHPESGRPAVGAPFKGPYTQVSVTESGGHSASTCAVRIDAEVVCWGYVARLDHAGSVTQFYHATKGSFSQAAAADTTACGLRTDGTISCWGRPYGEGASPPSGRFIDIAAGGGDSMCAVRQDDELICWDPETGSVHELGSGFADVSVGAEVCAVRTDSTVWCWGGFGVFASRPPQGAFVKVEASQYGSANNQQRPCGIRPDGRIECWGYHGVGEPPPSVGTLQQASVRFSPNWPGGRSCGVRLDGTLVCWLTLINHGPQDPWDMYIRIPSGTFTQVSVPARTYNESLCAIRDDSSVHCWHWGDPLAEAPTGRFSQISVADRHGCGIRIDGTVSCWGTNHEPPWEAPVDEHPSAD